MADIDLQKEVNKILSQYGTVITTEINEVIPKIAKDAVRELKSTSPKKSGEYAKSWKADNKKGRLGSTATVYSTKPGLPHLLEYGHALKGGGRTRAFPHIKKVEEKTVEALEKEIETAIDAAGAKV